MAKKKPVQVLTDAQVLDWRGMNDIQKLMVMEAFWESHFDADDCISQINDAVAGLNSESDDGLLCGLRWYDRDTAHRWRARLKNAVRQLDRMPVEPEDDGDDD